MYPRLNPHSQNQQGHKMPEYKIYPNSSPEFKTIQKPNGTIEMQVRYLNRPMNYVSQWMPVKIEHDNTNQSKT